MQLPVQITFRDITHSNSLEKEIRQKISKLEQFYARITACRVVIEAPHRNRNKGNQYHIRITLTVPDSELVVNRGPGDEDAHVDAYVAIRDAFNAMRRQLEDYTNRQGKIRGAGRVDID